MIEDKLSDSGQHINTTTLDLRHDGITVGDTGEIGLWLYGALRHQEVELNLEERSGFGFGIWHQHAPIPNSTNTLSLVYREGAAIPQGKINPQPVREAQGYDLNQANRWEVNNDFLYEPASPFALHWSLIYRHDESGVEGNTGDELVWLSTGIRPIYYFDDHLNLAFEYGFDWVENERTTLDGSLHKGTLALQMAISRGYFARPVLRLFATYAKWSDDFRGLVGTRPGDMAYANDTSGWSLGIQMEAWW